MNQISFIPFSDRSLQKAAALLHRNIRFPQRHLGSDGTRIKF